MELEKGKITVIKNYFDKEIYSPETSQIKHDNNRRKCGVKIKGYGKCEKFLKWIEVFYAHPYSSFERGTNENCNGIVRRKIPKSTYIKKYSDEDIRRVEQWVNDMPRKILGYQTANESYEQELKKLGISA